MDGLPGRVDDGTWLSGRVRPASQRVVRMDPAVRRVLRPVHTATQARSQLRLVVAAPRPADAARVLDLAGVLQPRPDWALRAARLPVPALPAGADAVARLRSWPPARAAAAAGAGLLARDRDRVPGRISDRAERHRFQRDRRRLCRCYRRRQAAPRQAAVRRLAPRQRQWRHLWPGQLLRLRPVPCRVRLERHMGRPAGRPCGRLGVRPADAARPVASGAPDPRADHRNRVRVPVGRLSVHAVLAQLQQQRFAGRDADRARDAS